jgi:hypothetical protein
MIALRFIVSLIVLCLTMATFNDIKFAILSFWLTMIYLAIVEKE